MLSFQSECCRAVLLSLYQKVAPNRRVTSRPDICLPPNPFPFAAHVRRQSDHAALPLPRPPGQGKSTLVLLVYALHWGSLPHFFSALFSRGGTPEAYLRRTCCQPVIKPTHGQYASIIWRQNLGFSGKKGRKEMGRIGSDGKQRDKSGQLTSAASRRTLVRDKRAIVLVSEVVQTRPSMVDQLAR